MTIRPSLFPDPAYGLLVHRSEQHGSAWNHRTQPDPGNIARNVQEFNAAWSPGQHAVPAVFLSLGLTLGGALTASNVLIGVITLAGWYLLLRRLQFSAAVALATLLLIAASRSLSFSYVTYVGGDMLALAAFPWLAWPAFALRRSWWLVAAAPLLIVTGFFFKNSMPIYVSAWIVSVVLVANVPRLPPTTRSAALVMTVGAAILIAAVFIERTYASRGWNAVSDARHWSTRPAPYLLPLAMPVLAGTGIDMLMSRVFDNPRMPAFDYRQTLPVPLVFAVVTIALGARVWRASRSEPARAVVMCVAITSLAFALLLASGSGGNLQFSRHYLIPGFLVLGLLVDHASRLQPTLARAVAGLLILPALYGTASFVSNWVRHRTTGASSEDQRITHLTLTPRALHFIKRLDRELPDDSLVVLPVPTLALEMTRTRTLPTNSTAASLPELQRLDFRGRVANLLLVVEDAGFDREEAGAWRQAFKGYDPHSWEHFSVDGYTFWLPAGQSITPAWLAQALLRETS